MKCPKCQFENPGDGTLCGRCRAPLHHPEQKSSHPTIAWPADREQEIIDTVFADKFRLFEVLGRGGMGVVYRAEDLTLGRTVAVKVLHPGRSTDAESRDRFVSEARTASGLDHPNICTIHEIGETKEGQIYITMAFCEGKSLRDHILCGDLDIRAIAEIGSQISQGLAAAHDRGIVHRDIKPENIMLTDQGVVKIVDFGLAKLEGGTRITIEGTIAGTVVYMSPEQARGADIDQRSDLWSLGVILYELITGQLPFRGENRQAILHAILNEKPQPAQTLVSDVPRELERIIDRSLQKSPAKRVASAQQCVDALEEMKARLSGQTISFLGGGIFRNRRRRAMIWAASLILILAGLLAAWSLMPPGLAFENRDCLLVADVDNRTDDPVFDLALRTAIEADLQQSPFARVFDVNEVSETLRLMRRDPSTRVDETLGIDICRFSGVRALILPRILSAGEAYELQAIIVDPVKKRHVERIRVSARGREEVLLEAIDELAHEVRTRLGESLDSIEQEDAPVARMTTSSWEALQQFSLGMARLMENKHLEGAAYFERALEEDPQFVGARMSLGLLKIDFLGQREEGVEMLSQALIDAESQDLPQHELLNLRALKRQYVDQDLEGALEEYRIYRELYPDLWGGFNNSGMILRALGQYDEAAFMLEKAADLASQNSIRPLSNLYFLQLWFRKDVKAAEEVARRLVELGPEMAFCQAAHGWSLIVCGRFEDSLPPLRKAVALEPAHPYALPNLAYVLLATGRAAESVPYFRKIRDCLRQGRMRGSDDSAVIDLSLALSSAGMDQEAVAAAEEGREAFLGRLTTAPPDTPELIMLAIFDVLCGDGDQAAARMGRIDPETVTDPAVIMIMAKYHTLTGNHDLAIATIGRALDQGYHDPQLPLIIPVFGSIRDDPRFKALFDSGKEGQP